jgi:hypothetical protein
MPGRALYVGRPTLFGNPFVNEDHDHAEEAEAYRWWITDGRDYEDILELYCVGLATNANPATLQSRYWEWLTTTGLQRLAGRDLACWCPEGSPFGTCHADWLLTWAEAGLR